NAKSQASNYIDIRDTLLASEPDRSTAESAGHAALADTMPVGDGSSTIDPVALTYFERAAAYGDGKADPDPCVDAATAAAASSKPVGAVCPRGDLTALAKCTGSAPGPNEMDPALIECGGGADDLALALSGGVPQSTWITRRTFVIAKDTSGEDA